MTTTFDDPRDRLDALLVDQARRWREGQALPVEAYLAENPDLAADPDARLDLAYGELRARRRGGEDVGVESLAGRFPDLRDELIRQVEVGCWAEGEGDALASEALGSRGGALGISCDMFVPPDPAEAPLSAADFVLGEALGSGGMGTVFRARQVSLGKPVALKILRDAEGLSPDSVRRLLAEGKAAARLRHPRIVGVHGIGRFADGSPFLVMDLIEGPSLADRLQDGTFEPGEAAAIVAEVADALEHAHGRGVVHRDLKPSNVLLDAEGRPFVTDFGLAKRFDDDAPGLTRPDQILGTPHYMAPEQADGRWGPVGPRSDVYGLGALLFAMLSGRPPFEGHSTLEVLSRVASTEPAPSLLDFRPDVPEGLAAVCLACLAKDPAHRPQSAGEVGEMLRNPSMLEVSAVKKTYSLNDEWGDFPPPAHRRTSRFAGTTLLLTVAVLTLAISAIAFALLIRQPTEVRSPIVLRPQVASRPPRPLAAPPPILLPAVIEPRPPAPVIAPPPKPEPFEVTWSVDRRRGEADESPIERPAPLIEGDRLRIQCRLSRPGAAYLFWLRADGSVVRLFPGPASVTNRDDRVEVAEDELTIGEASGTEYFILIVSQETVPGFTVAGWEKELSIFRPLGELGGDTVLIDGLPVGPEPRPDPHPGIARALKTLPSRINPRTATVSTLALPHAGAAP